MADVDERLFMPWSARKLRLVEIAPDVYALPMAQRATQAAPIAYRTAVVAADVLAAPTVAYVSDPAGGGLTPAANTAGDASGYNYSAVAVNQYGRSVRSSVVNTSHVVAAADVVRYTVSQVPGATHYDIYSNPDTLADPLFVGRVTEPQRAAGCRIRSDGVVSTSGRAAGGATGEVDVEKDGTGLAGGATAAQAMAYVAPPTAGLVTLGYVDCTGYEYADFYLTCSRTGDAVAPSLVVIPALYNSRTGTYSLSDPEALTFGGASAVYQSMIQPLRVEVRGSPRVALLVAGIAGTGMSLDMDVVLS